MMEYGDVRAGLNDTKALALTNYGHFTSMRVENGCVRGLELHLERLVRDCRALFDTELDAEFVRALTRKAVENAGAPAVVVRVNVFDPALDLSHPAAAKDPGVLVTARPAATIPAPPLRVRTVTYSREVPTVKHAGLFGPLRHRRTVQLAGYDDALFVDGQSRILEGPTWNIGFFDGEQVIWPEAECLPGVTMNLLRQVHNPTTTVPVTLSSVGAMRVAFATNAATAVRVVQAIDGTELAPNHPIVEKLRKEYAEIPPERL